MNKFELSIKIIFKNCYHIITLDFKNFESAKKNVQQFSKTFEDV